MASKIKVDTLETANGSGTITSSNPITVTGALTATTLVGDGSALTNLSAVTEIDRWYLNTNLSVPASDTYLTANLARSTVGGWTKLGTGMTESSGAFSFPSTGFWEVTHNGTFYKSSGDSRYLAANLMITNNNSTYSIGDEASVNMYSGGGTYASFNVKAIIEVTNLTNDKVKFKYYAINTATLNGSEASSNFTFTKLAEL